MLSQSVCRAPWLVATSLTGLFARFHMEARGRFCYDPTQFWIRDVVPKANPEVSMHTPQLDPSVSSIPLHPPCRHMRLVDRILTDKGQETDKVRCVECGDIIAAHTLWRPNDTASDRP